MSKATWVCFDCRQAVRREGMPSQGVKCAYCGKACHCIGHKIPTPRKQDLKGWEALRQSLNDWRQNDAEEGFRARVRSRHALEQEIARLEAKPPNPGRTRAIRLLRKRLGLDH